MPSLASSLAVSAALLFIPLAIWAQLANANVWQERLAVPRFTDEPNRHTPLHFTGTFLPPVIIKDRTITAADNPVIITKTVQVPSGVTLTIEPGTKIFAHEYALLDVSGQLQINGSPEKPVQFSSNEQHPVNQVWGGLVFETGSHGTIVQTIFHSASPAVSCLAGSVVKIDRTNITGSIRPLFNCVY